MVKFEVGQVRKQGKTKVITAKKNGFFLEKDKVLLIKIDENLAKRLKSDVKNAAKRGKNAHEQHTETV